MRKDLSVIFPSYQLFSEYPNNKDNNFLTFHDAPNNQWIQINKDEVSSRDYALLSSFYTVVDLTFPTNYSLSEKWIRFLHGSGELPIEAGTELRIIQLVIKNSDFLNEDLTKAVQLFFEDAVQLVFISNDNALLIEQKSTYVQSTEDLASFIFALESDFFIKADLFVGKFNTVNEQTPSRYTLEREWFSNGIVNYYPGRIYTLENIFPTILIKEMSESLRQIIHQEVLIPIEFDTELLQTVQAFFENGFNASITSKKLHIHRNTLHYRLSKFQEITGISVRDFDGALIVYCASLLVNYE
ncbi:PucR family transcriptional regulator [Psychrobacillus sp. FSL K6-1267]|uniref:PucR family transcriptional regulator n=1 Tax=Psychrobacillus sp. FSL K6-1267 TaxID=2921543 RepID=UPI0030FBB117